MVITNRGTKNTFQRTNYEIKPGLMLFTQNKMLPTLQSISQKVFVPNYPVTILKPKIIQLSKQENNKSVSLFLQEPSCIFHNKDKNELKVHQLTNKSKMRKQKYTIHNKSETLNTSICDTLKKFYKSRKLIQKKKKEDYLPFPNTINLLNTEYLSREKIIDRNKKSFIPTLKFKSDNSTRKKQEIHKQLYGKIHSTHKQIPLYNKNNALHNSNTLPPVTHKIYQEEQQANTNYDNAITTNFDHIQNKNLIEATELTHLKKRSINNKNSSSIPIDQVVFYNLIESKLHTKENTRKKNDDKKNKEYFNYSEQMVKITNYENKTLEMYHHKISNLTSNLDGKDMKKSMSAIHYKRSTQCMLDIRNNVSDPHIIQNKPENQKNKPRFKIQYSLEDADCMPMYKKDKYITTKCETRDNKHYRESEHDCKIKYSWQVIGTSCQTSNVLLYNLLEENKNQVYSYTNKPSIYKCNVKYSWQIIGTGTQVALQSNDNTDYWTGIVFKPNIHQDNKIVNSAKKKETGNDIKLYKLQQCDKNLPILTNQYTQTLTTKEIQSYCTDCKVKYSWQNLIWQHL